MTSFNLYSLKQQLKHCGDEKDLERALHLHQLLTKSGVLLEQDHFLSNLVLEMYGKCGSVDNAASVFTRIIYKNSFSWTLMLRAYAQNDLHAEALKLFHNMLLEGVKPEDFTLSTVLTVCSALKALTLGRTVDTCLIGSPERETNLYLGNCLLSMYSRCGELARAVELFDSMQLKDHVSWNTIITAFAQHGHFAEAIGAFQEMLQDGTGPTEKTFVSVIGACCSRKNLKLGRVFHLEVIVSTGCIAHVHVANSLVNMYGKCGSFEEARRILDSIKERTASSWNSMITACAHGGRERDALELFEKMDIEPNEVTYLGLVTACTGLEDLEEARRVHARIAKRGLDRQVSLGNSLVSMYGRFEAGLEAAEAAFEKIAVKNIISWNALMAAFAQNGHPERALQLFRRMDHEGIKPDKSTLTTALDACTLLEELAAGEEVHARLKSEALHDEVVGTALINLYGKCGRLQTAREIFTGMQSTDVVTWNAMLAVYAQLKRVEETVDVFREMALEGVDADHTSFVTLLFVCSHGGSFTDACFHFTSLGTDFGVTPGAEHYRCMVDVLGRVGQVMKAEQVIESMPFQSNSEAWMSLLGASKLQGNVELGVRAGSQVLRWKPSNASAYAVLSNMLGSTES